MTGPLNIPPRKESGIDLLSIGEPLAEFVQAEPGEAPAFTGFGGDVLNVAVAAARQGARTAFFTAVGDDDYGRKLLSLCAEEGIDTSAIITRTARRTGSYVIGYDESGHSFSYDRAGSAASELTRHDIPSGLIENSRALHISGISQAISLSARDMVFEAIARAKSAGVLVSYDSNLRLKLWPLEMARPVIHAAMRDADIARLSLEDARQLTGIESANGIVRYYIDLGAKSVALTLGGDGCLVGTPDSVLHIAAPQVDVVDASGAGDVFSGALLAELLEHGDLARAARYAVTAAALQTRLHGTIAAIPRRSKVEAAFSESMA